jgi:hypothetical protein
MKPNAFIDFPEGKTMVVALINKNTDQKGEEERRFTISFEKDPEQSFWFVISSRHKKPIRQGSLKELKPDEIKKLMNFEVV